MKESQILYTSDQARLTLMINTLETAVFFVDVLQEKKFRYFAVNRQYEKKMGLQNKEVTGKEPEALFEAEYAAKMTTHYQRCIKQKKAIEYSDYINSPSNKHWLNIHLIPIFDKDGAQIIRIWGTLIETNAPPQQLSSSVIEEKHSKGSLHEYEKQCHLLYQESLTGDYIATITGELLLCNLRFAQIFGFDSIESAMNSNINSLYPDPKNYKQLLELLKKHKKLEYHESKFQHLNGEPICIVQNIIGIFDKEEKLVKLKGYMFDDTARKNAEMQVRQEQKMEAIETLVSGIAHDFNNMIAAIMGYAEMTQEDVEEDSLIYQNLKSIYEAGTRAKNLVKKIQTFSQRTEYETAPLKINSLLKETLQSFIISLPSTINVEQYIDPDCGEILADPYQIQQVIINLCTNACEAMGEEGGILKIFLKNLPFNSKISKQHIPFADGNYLKLSIHDTGHGMDQKTLQQIFDPFFTTKKVGEGKGLGLSVVHGIIESLKGKITVKSIPGQGSWFDIYLLQSVAPDKIKSKSTKPVSGGKEHILLVDDEKLFTQLGKQLLGRLGYQVTVINNSLEALALFRNKSDSFDLVITDHLMPNMDGIEFSGEVLRIRSNIPILLITGLSENISLEKAKAIGIYGYITKPVNNSKLTSTIRNILDHYKEKY